MHRIRSTTIIAAFLFTIQLFQGPTMAAALSSQLKENIRYLLNLTGVENEYVRFLSYMKIYSPEDNMALKVLYDDLFSHEAYMTDLGQIYGKYYTLDDVKDLIRFYSSPLGKKTLQMRRDLDKQMEEIMLNKISDYIFTAAEHGFDVPVLQITKWDMLNSESNSVVFRLFFFALFSQSLPINLTSATFQPGVFDVEHVNAGCQWMFHIRNSIQ